MLNLGDAFSVVNPLISEHVNIYIYKEYTKVSLYVLFCIGCKILGSRLKVYLRGGC
jgi:hypothetical protein